MRTNSVVLITVMLSLGLAMVPGAIALGEELRHESQYQTYIVRAGDTLSEILKSLGFSPLWGQQGYVGKIYDLNRQRIKSADKINPGNALLIPHRSVANTVDSAPLVTVPEKEKVDIKKAAICCDSNIIFTVGSGYTRIDAKISSNGSQATLLSKQIMDLSLRWEQNWSEDFHSFIGWSFQSVPFRATNIGQLYGENQEGMGLFVGGRAYFLSRWSLALSLGIQDYYYVPSYAMGTATVEVKSLPFLKSEIVREVFQHRSLHLEAGGAFTWIGSSSDAAYRISNGSAYSGLLRIGQKFQQNRLFAEVEYEQLSQDTSQFKIERKDIFGRLGFAWGL